MYVLYEHASGYVLVHCEQTDDINEMQVNVFNYKPLFSISTYLGPDVEIGDFRDHPAKFEFGAKISKSDFG